VTAEPPDLPDGEPSFFPLPDDLGSLSDEEVARLAAGIWAEFVGPRPDEPEAGPGDEPEDD
jgi:hypothetical protein